MNSTYNQVKSMTSMQHFQDITFEENWSWVDKLLEELYYGYALTVENSDEYAYAGLLNERWAWVDQELENQSHEAVRILCPTPITWMNNEETIVPLEETIVPLEETRMRRRAESDISDYSDTVEQVINKLVCEPVSYSYSDSDTEIEYIYNHLHYDCTGYDSP